MIDQYNLKIEDLSEHQTLLIGADYALLFSVRYGEVDLLYFWKNHNGYQALDIWNYCVHQFDSDDRMGFSDQDRNNLKSIFTVLAKGLKRHFSNILLGEKSWIENYKNYELSRPILMVNNNIQELLKKYF